MSGRTTHPVYSAIPATSRLEIIAAAAGRRVHGNELRIPCPAHQGEDDNLALWVDSPHSGRIAARCYSQNCSYREIARAIEGRYRVSLGDPPQNPATIIVCQRTRPPARPSAPPQSSTSGYSRSLWLRSLPIPTNPNHPARLWLRARHLWRPELPLPSAVRWIEARWLHRDFTGAGAIIALVASPAQWQRSWPAAPQPEAVQLVFVAADGAPARDRGLTKRTYGPSKDRIVVLGDPRLELASGPVEVAEGLADALSLASRTPAPAIAALGTGGMASPDVARWLASAQQVRVWSDRDLGKRGRPPPGQVAGRGLLRLLIEAGGCGQAVYAPSPHKDPAEASAAAGFGSLTDGWPDYARSLAETAYLPRWECARQATAMFAEESGW